MKSGKERKVKRRQLTRIGYMMNASMSLTNRFAEKLLEVYYARFPRSMRSRFTLATRSQQK